jgi:hypothetical protein
MLTLFRMLTITAVALLGLFIYPSIAAVSPELRTRDDPINNIAIRMDKQFQVDSGTTLLDGGGSHAWGDGVTGKHDLITIAGLGEPDQATSDLAVVPIVKQTMRYRGAMASGSQVSGKWYETSGDASRGFFCPHIAITALSQSVYHGAG